MHSPRQVSFCVVRISKCTPKTGRTYASTQYKLVGKVETEKNTCLFCFKVLLFISYIKKVKIYYLELVFTFAP